MTDSTKDPVRDAFARCSRILERLATDDERRRVINAFVALMGMTDPKAGS